MRESRDSPDVAAEDVGDPDVSGAVDDAAPSSKPALEAATDGGESRGE
ncbi:hypothetical protein G9C85_06265 [Halorubellus sp. JP-L1]|nr:hypothetical protein [Halorubellus sp. JP-L1]NHN41241.1 hypothetical protein [Halorubellus sp. JP-L1]